ncbi:MAG TPA: M20/M25/M40 family metallo-hydrolase [Gemmatimonadota bacterium]|nr:M20/M25/M40 family metallo-hydrolase [Gemmatimonadota bacterium]
MDPDFVRDILAELVAIDSRNPTLVPGAPGEGPIAARVAGMLEALGMEVETVEPVPGRPSVIGRRRGEGGGRSLMLNGHLDTVGVEGMESPFEPRIENGRLHGRGSYDMKGSLAACLAAVKALVDVDVALAGDLVVAAVADEEVASIGTSAVIERARTDGAIVTEPTELAVCLAHKGFAWIEIEVEGRAAHGSRADLGVDANLAMGRVLAEVAGLERELAGRLAHPRVGRPSLHVGTLAGGTGWSTYAARAIAGVERRMIPGETAEGALAEVTARLTRLERQEAGRHPIGSGIRATARIALAREPFEADPDAPLVRALERAAEDVLGRRPERVGVAYWMDAALLGAAGIETAVIGPAGAGAHEDEEWVDLDSCVRLAEILAHAAILFCGPRNFDS